MKQFSSLLLACSFVLLGCASQNDDDICLLAGPTLCITVDEMVNYPDVMSFSLSISFQDTTKNDIIVTVSRVSATDFSTSFIGLPQGDYAIKGISCFFKEPELKSQFESVAYNIRDKNTIIDITDENASDDYSMSIDIWSVTYYVDPDLMIKDTVHNVGCSSYFRLFVNRCNNDVDANIYHEVLRYQIIFKNPEIIGLPADSILNNYSNLSIPLLTISNGYQIRSANESISVELIPFDDNDADGIWTQSGDITYNIDISEIEWNKCLSGDVSFVHLQIGC